MANKRGKSRMAANVEMQKLVLDKLQEYPIDVNEFVSMVLQSVELMMQQTFIGKSMREVIDKAPNKGSFIGQLFPIAFNQVLLEKYGDLFRAEENVYDKDVVCKLNSYYDFEIKTSTSNENITGNQSYTVDGGHKEKSSFYLAVNFDKIDYSVNLIRFGWLDIDDWSVTKSTSGQGSIVKTLPRRSKMITLYERAKI